MKDMLKTLIIAFSGIIVRSALLITISMFTDNGLYASLIANIVTFILGGLYVSAVLRDPPVYNQVHGKFVAVSAAIVVYYSFVSLFTSNLIIRLAYSAEDIAAMNASQSSSDDMVLAAVTSIIFAPLAEEMIYRRFLYKTLTKYGNTKAVVISSAVFALLHGTVYHLYAAFVGGIIFCHIYNKTQKLRYSIAAHILYNLVSYFIVFIPYQGFMQEVWWIVFLNSVLLLSFFIYSYMPASDAVQSKRELTEERKQSKAEISRIVDEVMAEYKNKR